MHDDRERGQSLQNEDRQRTETEHCGHEVEDRVEARDQEQERDDRREGGVDDSGELGRAVRARPGQCVRQNASAPERVEIARRRVVERQ